MNKRVLVTAVLAIAVLGVGYVVWSQSESQKVLIVRGVVPQSVEVNKELRVPVTLSTRDEVINALEVFGNVSPDDAELKAIESENTFIALWVKDQPKISSDGSFSMRGGIPQTGFQGDGVIGTLVLVPKKTGTFRVTFTSKSRILKHDGRGTVEPVRLDDIVITAR